MFLFYWGEESAGRRGPGRVHRANLRQEVWATPACDRPLVLLVTTEDVVRELRSAAGSPYYFGGSGADPATGIERQLREAVRLAAHPVDLVRRLGEWTDRVQAMAPAGLIATCWHPAVTSDVLRQASRYPVRVVQADTADEALAAATPLLAEVPRVGVA